jgi:D-alanyl-lipoteichoic acid acyltransferase DltB (MBOAT superfamily)
MSFVSLSFLLFLVIVLLCYFVAPQKARWCVLLAVSYIYYWLVGGLFAISIISFTILTVYASGLWAGLLRRRYGADSQGSGRAMRRVPLGICLTLNIGLLMFLRYSDVIIPSVGLLLIPGVSFYTFQASGYLIDIYTGKVEPERNLFRLALFLSFFPQLVQGPISRHGEIAADLYAGHSWDWERARSGTQRIVWGFFMKFLVANYAGTMSFS